MKCLVCGADIVGDSAVCSAESCVAMYERTVAENGVGAAIFKRWEIAAKLLKQVEAESGVEYGMTLVVHPREHDLANNQVGFASTLSGQTLHRKVLLDCVFRSLLMSGMSRENFIDELNAHVEDTFRELLKPAEAASTIPPVNTDPGYTMEGLIDTDDGPSPLDRLAARLCFNLDGDSLLILIHGGEYAGFSVQVDGETPNEVAANLHELELDVAALLEVVRENLQRVQESANQASA